MYSGGVADGLVTAILEHVSDDDPLVGAIKATINQIAGFYVDKYIESKATFSQKLAESMLPPNVFARINVVYGLIEGSMHIVSEMQEFSNRFSAYNTAEELHGIRHASIFLDEYFARNADHTLLTRVRGLAPVSSVCTMIEHDLVNESSAIVNHTKDNVKLVMSDVAGDMFRKWGYKCDAYFCKVPGLTQCN